MKTPTFFSRIFEVDYALGHVADKYRMIGYGALLEDSQYTRIVYDTLGLMEFMFLNGASVRIEKIDLDLGYTEDVEKRVARNAISRSLADLPGYAAQWYLFRYINGSVVGGSSPFTYAYPAPELPDRMRKHHIDDYDAEFIAMLCAMRPAFSENMQAFIDILYHSAAPLPPMEIADFAASEKYSCLKDSNGRDVMVNGVPFFCLSTEALVEGSDYMIRPTREGIDASRLPLVIGRNNRFPGKFLYKNSGLPQETDVADAAGIPLENRILPDTGIEYPFVCASDFIEDRLMEISADYIDAESYRVLRSDSGRVFLFPLKPLFFRYYTKDVLERQVRLSENDDETISLSLEIPVSGGYVNFGRTYSAANIFRCDVNVGIMPFHKSEKPVKRHVYIHDAADVSISLFSADRKIPCEFTSLDQWMQHTATEENIDAVQIVSGGCSALLVPVFKQLPYPHPAPALAYTVHIGDLFTSIECSGPAMFHRSDVFGMESPLRALHCKNPCFDSVAMPCGAPSVPGWEKPVIKCPLPARLVSRTSHEHLPELFCDSHIPLAGLNEYGASASSPQQGIADGDLALAELQPGRSPYIYKVYVEELIFLMREKSLMEYGTDEIIVNVVVDESLSESETHAARSCWRTSWRETYGDHNIHGNLRFIDLAEMLAMENYVKGCDRNTLNIHIDENHTCFVQIDDFNPQPEVHAHTVPFGFSALYKGFPGTMSLQTAENVARLLMLECRSDSSNYFRIKRMVSGGFTPLEIMHAFERDFRYKEGFLFDGVALLVGILVTHYINHIEKLGIRMPETIRFSGYAAEQLRTDRPYFLEEMFRRKGLREPRIEIYSGKNPMPLFVPDPTHGDPMHFRVTRQSVNDLADIPADITLAEVMDDCSDEVVDAVYNQFLNLINAYSRHMGEFWNRLNTRAMTDSHILTQGLMFSLHQLSQTPAQPTADQPVDAPADAAPAVPAVPADVCTQPLFLHGLRFILPVLIPSLITPN